MTSPTPSTGQAGRLDDGAKQPARPETRLLSTARTPPLPYSSCSFNYHNGTMANADRIFLEGIEVFAHGGVTEGERQTGQRYVIDISVEFDISSAAATDSIDDTLSYVALHDLAVVVMTAGPFNLLESKGAQIAWAILAGTEATSVSVRLRKLLPPIDGTVAASGVEITRRRGSS